MLQLNNKKTGEIIRIVDFRLEDNSVRYEKYDTIMNIDNEDIFVNKSFGTVKLPKYDIIDEVGSVIIHSINIKKMLLNGDNNILDKILDFIKDNVVVDFVKELNNDNNWIFNEPSHNKKYRICINNDESSKEQINNIVYRTLLNDMLVKHDGYFVKSNKWTTLYVSTIDDTDTSKLPINAINKWILFDKPLNV